MPCVCSCLDAGSDDGTVQNQEHNQRNIRFYLSLLRAHLSCLARETVNNFNVAYPTFDKMEIAVKVLFGIGAALLICGISYFYTDRNQLEQLTHIIFISGVCMVIPITFVILKLCLMCLIQTCSRHPLEIEDLKVTEAEPTAIYESICEPDYGYAEVNMACEENLASLGQQIPVRHYEEIFQHPPTLPDCPLQPTEVSFDSASATVTLCQKVDPTYCSENASAEETSQ